VTGGVRFTGRRRRVDTLDPTNPDFTWEATDKAAKLASDAGVREPVAARK
jgi:hypothetical protein